VTAGTLPEAAHRPAYLKKGFLCHVLSFRLAYKPSDISNDLRIILTIEFRKILPRLDIGHPFLIIVNDQMLVIPI